MKERPILFNDEMVRALLDGRKTQTRRIVKPQPEVSTTRAMGPNKYRDHVQFCTEGMSDRGGCSVDGLRVNNPYGQPGDRLWVRETWARYNIDQESHDMAYRATTPADWPVDGRWRPSVHMPRWASRILLEIVSVRVERLNSISEEDAEAEGAFFTDYGRQCFHRGALTGAKNCPEADDHHPQRSGWATAPTKHADQCLPSACMAFAKLWESISGAGSWGESPWVWVVEFKRAEGNRESV